MYSIPGEEASESGNILLELSKISGFLKPRDRDHTSHHASSHRMLPDVAWPRQQLDGDVNNRFE